MLTQRGTEGSAKSILLGTDMHNDTMLLLLARGIFSSNQGYVSMAPSPWDIAPDAVYLSCAAPAVVKRLVAQPASSCQTRQACEPKSLCFLGPSLPLSAALTTQKKAMARLFFLGHSLLPSASPSPLFGPPPLRL